MLPADASAMPERIVTGRLVLRPYGFDDIDDVFDYARDPEWARFLPIPQPYTKEMAASFIDAQVLLDRGKHGSWAVEHENRVIGGVDLTFADGGAIADLGYSIARVRQGRGLATEAARAVVDAAFATIDRLHRMRASVDVLNLPSVRVVEKLGFTREGVLRRNRSVRGVYVDEAIYGLLRDDHRQG